MYSTDIPYEVSDNDFPNYTPQEWEQIIADYMNNNSDSDSFDSDDNYNQPMTSGWGNPRVNQWYKRTGGPTFTEFVPGPMAPDSNTSDTGLFKGYHVPIPLENQAAKLEEPLSAEEESQPIVAESQPAVVAESRTAVAEPPELEMPDIMGSNNEPVQQQTVQPKVYVVYPNSVPQTHKFYTSAPPNKGIYAQRHNEITNVNNGQYLSNVSPETIGYLNQPAQSRNINAITDDGNIMCINCVDCRNCFNCTSCKICEKCISCNTCNTCSSCLNCVGSTNCINCEDCNNCKSVRDSTKCNNCNNCVGCKDCTNCNDLSWAIGYVNNKPKM